MWFQSSNSKECIAGVSGRAYSLSALCSSNLSGWSIPSDRRRLEEKDWVRDAMTSPTAIGTTPEGWYTCAQ